MQGEALISHLPIICSARIQHADLYHEVPFGHKHCYAFLPFKKSESKRWVDWFAHLRSFGAFADLPAFDLILACCKEVDELDCPESGGDDLWQGAHCFILQIQTMQDFEYVKKSNMMTCH